MPKETAILMLDERNFPPRLIQFKIINTGKLKDKMWWFI